MGVLNKPRCFPSTKVWEEWAEAAEQTDVKQSAFCRDCTPDFKKDAGRLCKHPEVRFVLKENRAAGDGLGQLPGMELIGIRATSGWFRWQKFKGLESEAIERMFASQGAIEMFTQRVRKTVEVV